MTDSVQPARILVVEDEQIVALDLRETLEQLGYHVVGTAGTAAEAIQLAEAAAPDLVLMDIHLQGEVDGISTADRIRAHGGPPVVFVTAFDDARTLARARVTEPYGYLLKPFNVRELRATIEMAIFHHRMQRERAELTRQLRDTLEEVTHLRQLLHMCAYCRRIADDEGHWEELETYLKRRTGTSISHGACPECVERLLADMDVNGGQP